MNINRSTLLRLLALLAFAIGAVICLLDDTPDMLDVYASALIAGALLVGSTLVRS